MSPASADESPRSPTGISCVVADDHPALGQALARILSADGIEVLEQVSGGAALEAIKTFGPTVAILDLVLPPDELVDMVRRAGTVSPHTAVILYTGFAESELLVQALEAGTRGFVLKDAPLEELLQAVKVVGGGEVYVDPALGATLIRAGSGTKHRSLSAREREILRLLSEGKSNKVIAEELVISPDTVRTYIRRAMDKLDADTRTQAVAVAIRSGVIP
jgi:NarL family two-component system response regulator LiaR